MNRKCHSDMKLQPFVMEETRNVLLAEHDDLVSPCMRGTLTVLPEGNPRKEILPSDLFVEYSIHGTMVLAI